MTGFNINDLPHDLQQKLQPYANIAKSADEAVAMAKENGKWTAADEKAYNALNGGKAWEQVVDGFTSNTKEYNNEMAQNNKAKKAYDVTKGATQAELDKKRANLRKSMASNLENGNLTSFEGIKNYGKAIRDAYVYNITPQKAGIESASTGAWAAAAILTVATLFTSCSETEINEMPPIKVEDPPINIQMDYDSLRNETIKRIDELKNVKNNSNLSEKEKEELTNAIVYELKKYKTFAETALNNADGLNLKDKDKINCNTVLELVKPYCE